MPSRVAKRSLPFLEVSPELQGGLISSGGLWTEVRVLGRWCQRSVGPSACSPPVLQCPYSDPASCPRLHSTQIGPPRSGQFQPITLWPGHWHPGPCDPAWELQTPVGRRQSGRPLHICSACFVTDSSCLFAHMFVLIFKNDTLFPPELQVNKRKKSSMLRSGAIFLWETRP